MVFVSIGFAIGYGSYLVQTSAISSGSFVLFIAALMMFYIVIKRFGINVKGMKNLEAKEYIVNKPEYLSLKFLKTI